MSLSKRGNIYWYDFKKYGKRYRDSTGCTSKKKAREIEDKVKTDIAQNRVGLLPQKASPTLAVFLGPNGKFLTHIENHAKKPKTKQHYREKAKQLLLWPVWCDMTLSEITGDIQNEYAKYRRKTIGEWTLRSELGTLRRALKLAQEWRLAPAMKVQLPPEPAGRSFIVNAQLEAEYLAATRYPLRQVAILMLDLGLRPEEVVRLRATDIDLTRESLVVQEGKTKNARRALPLTKRAKETLEELIRLFGSQEWLFPSGKAGRHYHAKSLDNAHAKLRTKMGWPEEFDIYCFRHTYATGLAESGAKNWEIMLLLGHGDLRTSARYIHPTAETLALAMKRKEALDLATRGEQNASKYPQISHGQPVND